MAKLLGAFAFLVSAQGCNLVLDCNFAGCVEGCDDCGACSDCGCDCASCQECGLEPIPGAYSSTTVENAAQLRFTSDGQNFIEANVNGIVGSLGGVAGFDLNAVPIPPQTGSEVGVNYSACPLVPDPVGGPDIPSCYLDVDIENMQIQPIIGTNRLEILLDIAMSTEDETGASGPIAVDLSGLISGSCDLVFNDLGFNYRVEVGFEEIPAGRIFAGYGSLVVGAHDFVADPVTGHVGLHESQIDDSACDNLCVPIINWPCIDGTVDIDATIAAAGNATIQGDGEPGLVDMLDGFLCYQVQDASFCPVGSSANDISGGMGLAYSCIENGGPNGGNCVPLVLGSENRVNFGTLLGGISPSTTGQADMVLAILEGAADASGYSMPFISGAVPAVDGVVGRETTCLPASALSVVTPPPTPSLANAFNTDTHPDGTTDHHMAFGISEDYGDWYFEQLWRGGAFCLQVGTGLDQMLSTGLLSILIPHLEGLAFPESSVAMVIDVRPLASPDVTIGAGTAEDPTIQIAMNNLDLDFYVWSSERYVRFMTLNNDFKLGLNLEIDSATGDISVTLDQLAMENASVRNDEMLGGDNSALGTSIAGLLGGPLVANFLPEGGIPVFTLPALGSLTLDLDIGQVDEGGERFLGTFITMGGDFSDTMPLGKRAETTVEVTRVDAPDEAPFRADTLGQGELPSVEIAMAGSGFDGDYEFQYSIDGLGWSAWSASRYAVANSPNFLLQGVHSIRARARAVGVPHSSDMSPAEAEFIVDIDAPSVETSAADGDTLVRVDDIVSPVDALEYRTREGDGEWSEWATLGAHELTIDGDVEVQVRDEAGNVGGAEEELRGLPENSGGGGCGGCASAGSELPLAGFGILAMFGMLLSRRRREDV